MISRRKALASIGGILPFTAPQAFAARMGVVFVKAESAVGLRRQRRCVKSKSILINLWSPAMAPCMRD